MVPPASIGRTALTFARRALLPVWATALLAGCTTVFDNQPQNAPIDAAFVAQMAQDRGIVTTNTIGLSLSGGGLRAVEVGFAQHTHQHLAGSRDRVGHLGPPQHLGAAGLGDFNQGHGLRQSHVGVLSRKSSVNGIV